MLRQSTRQELFPRVEGLCQHLLQNRAVAKETAEDIWTDFVLHHASKVESPAATEAYLRILTVRRCRRLKQLQGRQVPLDPLTHERPSDEPSPEATLIAAQEQEHRSTRLAHCMDKLDASAVRLLRLRYHLGLTQESIGEQLGVSKQYAGRILARAVDALRTCVEAAA